MRRSTGGGQGGGAVDGAGGTEGHLDRMADKRVSVARVEEGKPKSISFFSMFE